MADTNLTQLIINELTRAQYDAIQPQPNQLYLVTDEPYLDTSYIVTSIGVSSTDLKVPSAKAVYNFVHNNSEGFLKSITGTQVTTALGYTPYNSSNPAGYITGINSSMVTTALGYTPYNSSNPSGYQTATNVNSAISTHNTNQTAHQDIRNAIIKNLSGLNDVSVSGVTSGQFLAWNGSKWAPSTSSVSVSFADISGNPSDNTNLANALNSKQGTLTAGTNITIDANNVISSTGGASSLGDIAVAGTNITFEDGPYKNFNIIGSLTINNGIAVGFNANNYIETKTALPSSITSFEMVMKFKTPTTISSSSVYPFLSKKGALTYIGIQGSTSKLEHYSGSGTLTGTTTLAANTVYTLKIKKESGVYKYYINNVLQFSYSSLIYAGYVMEVGISKNYATGIGDGYIDLNNTSITIDGSNWWIPLQDIGTKKIINSSGLVNTATGTASLTIEGNATTNNYAVNIGNSSRGYTYGTSLGYSATITANNGVAIGYSTRSQRTGGIAIGARAAASSGGTGSNAIALGYSSTASAGGAIMLGCGTNSEAKTLKVALNDTTTAATSEATGLYTLLNSTGKVPIERLGGSSVSTNNKFLKEDGSWAEVQSGSKKTFDILDFKWSDHELNDQNWLNAETFSWQSGTVYSEAYQHLVADLVDATASIETVGSYSITVYTATDGHKIVLDDMESTVANIFNDYGVAWYYIVDTTNTRFKLPRSTYNKYSKNQALPVKGTGKGIGFTDGTNTFGKAYASSTPRFYPTVEYDTNVGTSATHLTSTTRDVLTGLTTDSAKSGIEAVYNSVADSNMKLYFYVGEFSQSATEQTAGLNAELFNGKVDIDSLVECHTVIETYQNGTEWYRLYSDGWVEQGGIINSVLSNTYTAATITFLKQFKDTNYYVNLIQWDDNQSLGISASTGGESIHTKAVNSCVVAAYSWTYGRMWEAKGYAAQQ